MSNTNTNTQAQAPVESFTVTRRNIVAKLSRTETERKKEGDATKAYWTIDLSQFDTQAPTGKKLADGKDEMQLDVAASALKLASFFGYDLLVEKLQAKFNQDVRAAQLDGTKDSYTMDQKREYAISYIQTGIDGGRTVKKSPVELAQKEFNDAAAILRAKAEKGELTAEQFAVEIGKAQQALVAAILATTNVSMPTMPAPASEPTKA